MRDTRRVPTWARVLVSMIIVLHFAAIVVAVTGASSGRFAAPPLMTECRELLNPYLQPLFLGSPYRFFAPNPGVDPSFWVRIQFRNGATRTIEWPHFRDRTSSVAYTRDFCIPRSIVRIVDEGDDKPAKLSQEAEVLLASAARRLAKYAIPETLSDRTIDIEHLDIYCIERRLPMPSEVRTLDPASDLKLYGAIYLGRYDTEGKRLNSDLLMSIELDSLITTIIDRDIRPFDHAIGTDSDVADKYRRRWPTLIDSLLSSNNELLSLDRAELHEGVQSLLKEKVSE